MGTIVTTKAKKKMLQARAGIISSLPTIAGMAFGTGGYSGGVVVDHDPDDNVLFSESYRKAIDGYTVVSDTQIRYACTIAAGVLDNTYISEVGLYDSAGDFVAFKSFLQKGKDADIEVVFECDDTF